MGRVASGDRIRDLLHARRMASTALAASPVVDIAAHPLESEIERLMKRLDDELARVFSDPVLIPERVGSSSGIRHVRRI